MATTIRAVHNMYGESVFREYTPQHMAGPDPIRAAPPGGGEYLGRGKCQANNDTCEGFPARGTPFCIGHLRAIAKADGQPDPVKREEQTDEQR